MSVLVLAEVSQGGIGPSTRNAVAAARSLGELHLLVAGEDCQASAAAAAQLDGVAKVILADGPALANNLPEPLAALLVALAPAHTHLVAAATSIGKNVMPRAAALLDAQVLSDVIAVVDAETFVRPIYAGNALVTVKSADKIRRSGSSTTRSASTPSSPPSRRWTSMAISAWASATTIRARWPVAPSG